MKQLAILLALLGMSGIILAATIIQPAAPPISVLTATQVAASTPTYTGQVVVCSNCATNGGVGTICVSTEAANAQNAFVLSTGTVCK